MCECCLLTEKNRLVPVHFLNMAQKESVYFWFSKKAVSLQDAVLLLSQRWPSDTHQTVNRPIFDWKWSWLCWHFDIYDHPTVCSPRSQNTNKFSWGWGGTVERHFALGTAAMLKIALRALSPGWFDQAEEIIKPEHGHAQLSPNSLWARGRRERQPVVDTSPKSIAPGLISGTASIPGHSIPTPWSINELASSPQLQPSEAIYPFHTLWVVKVMKRCCVSLYMSILLCFLRHSVLSENSLTEETSQEEQQPRNSAMFPGPAERSRGSLISVPGSMLRNIRRYREDYEAYLRIVAHEAVGSFNPWAIAER